MADWEKQIKWLLTLSNPVACIAWTVTHEEVLKEPREYCVKCSKESKNLLKKNSSIFLPANTASVIV